MSPDIYDGIPLTPLLPDINKKNAPYNIPTSRKSNPRKSIGKKKRKHKQQRSLSLTPRIKRHTIIASAKPLKKDRRKSCKGRIETNRIDINDEFDDQAEKHSSNDSNTSTRQSPIDGNDQFKEDNTPSKQQSNENQGICYHFLSFPYHII